MFISTNHKGDHGGEDDGEDPGHSGGLASGGLDQAGDDRTGAGEDHDPSQPARVGPAPRHGQAVEDEGDAGEEDVEEGAWGARSRSWPSSATTA